ncbi:MAG: hypothetical protein K2Q32_01510 [Alphaproteobacteria bacterium]|nr:hypothetical protein [Alphaproteobacteria bacterium]
MKLTKRIRLMGALHSVARKQEAEVREAARKELSERNRKNAKKALPRISEDEKTIVRGQWDRVLLEFPDCGNRPRFRRMRELLNQLDKKIDHPETVNFGNWLKLRI